MLHGASDSDVGNSGLPRPTKNSTDEAHRTGCTRQPFPLLAQPANSAAAATLVTTVTENNVVSSSTHAGAFQQLAVSSQGETDIRSRSRTNERAFAPSTLAARGSNLSSTFVNDISFEVTQSDTHQSNVLTSPIDMSSAAVSPASLGARRTFSRQSVSSEGLDSAEYHSLGSPALPTVAVEGLPGEAAVEAAAAAAAGRANVGATLTNTRQQQLQLTPSPNVEWRAEVSEVSVPAVVVAARQASMSSSTPSPLFSPVPARTATATASTIATSTAGRQWAAEGQQVEQLGYGVYTNSDRNSGAPSYMSQQGLFVPGISVSDRNTVSHTMREDSVSQRGGSSRLYCAGAGAHTQLSGFSNTTSTNSNGAHEGSGGDDAHNHRENNSKPPLQGRQLCYQPFRSPEPVCLTRTASASEWVLLNVGGRLITTTVSTLMADPDSMLASLCACLTRPLPPLPPLHQQQQQPHRGIFAGDTAHHDPNASPPAPSAPSRRSIKPIKNSSSTAVSTTNGVTMPADVSAVPQRRAPEQERRDEPPLTSGGGGDAPHSLAGDYEEGDDNNTNVGRRETTIDAVVDEEQGMLAGDAATTSISVSHTSADVATAAAIALVNSYGNNGPLSGDGDHSNPSPDPPRRSAGGFAARPSNTLQQQQLRVSSPPLPPPPPASLTPSPAAAAVTAVVADQEEGDGEAVNPQQTVSAVPLDTDRNNAILLDLDADYFIPVLNYLRHNAVMIPQHINVDGVLAMAEYLNVTGLVRLLRGPPVPRRVLLFSWGSGSNGELGTHAMRDEPNPTMAQVAPFGVRVREIALGANYSCALTDRGHIYTFGNGEWGQLGLGSGLLGGRSGISANGSNNNNSSGGGGGNNSGVAHDGSGADVPVELLIPRRIPLFEQIPAVHVAAGYAFAMAIAEGYHVYFWGNNNHGQSGRGRNFFDPHTKKVDTPVLVETLEGKRIIQLSCGSFFALALSEDGALYSWGLVDCVGLGTPEEVERRYHAVLGESLSNERRSVVLTPQLVTVKGRRRTGVSGNATANASDRIVRIRAGQWHSGAINEYGELFTWGVGYQGRLGHGSKAPEYVPTLVQGALKGQYVVDVACGSFHTVALTAHGDVFCWGDNASGQCGTTANSPDSFTAPYRVVGLEYVAGGVARGIACGRQHTVVVMDGPQPWCRLPCCQVDASGRAAHSHGQVYCFGEVTRTGNGASSSAAAAAAAAAARNNSQPRGSVGGSQGVPVNAVSASALPGSPNLNPFAAGGANGAFLFSTAGLDGFYGGRPTLAGTAGHHHPHYQLVTGLQHVDVRAVVSGLHHTFVYAEELMVNAALMHGAESDKGDKEVFNAAHFAPTAPSYPHGLSSPSSSLWDPRHPSMASAYQVDVPAHGYTPYYGASFLPLSSPLRRGQYATAVHNDTSSMTRNNSAGAAAAAAAATTTAAAAPPFYLRSAPAESMSFYPPNWSLGGSRPPVQRQQHLSSSSGVSASTADPSAGTSNRRFFLPS